MIITMMVDRYGHQKAIEELREEWLEKLLSFLGVDIQMRHEMEPAHFKDYLLEQKIGILEYLDLQALQVFYESEPVGEWASPVLQMKQDEKGVLYYEVRIECWSIIEENIGIQ